MKDAVFRGGPFIDGHELIGAGREKQWIRSPYSGRLVGEIDCCTLEDLELALTASHRVFQKTMRCMPAHLRSDILRNASDLLEMQAETFVRMMALEAGKPIAEGRAEARRAVQLLRFAAEEAKRASGELVPMDAAAGGENRIGIVRRCPAGVVAAITPYNFPLNLVLHKLAPAFAAGNTVVLKPAGQTTCTAIMLARLFGEAGLPDGALNVVPGQGSILGEPLVTDPRVARVTFTGSEKVGLSIRRMAGMKRVTLELGSNSPNLIFEDADMELASRRLIKGAFGFSGQICISAQRIYVQQSVFQPFLDAFHPLAEKLALGDPLEGTTDIGPMINEEEAVRAEKWIREAQERGARVLIGGKRDGAFLQPTIMTDVTPDMKIVCEEVFAPIVSVMPFITEEEAIRLANDSRFGIQAGVFTNDLNRAMRLADKLETGGVWINEMSAYRQDSYPYGGVKQSGIGREGVKYAIDEMTDIKFIGIHLHQQGGGLA